MGEFLHFLMLQSSSLNFNQFESVLSALFSKQALRAKAEMNISTLDLE